MSAAYRCAITIVYRKRGMAEPDGGAKSKAAVMADGPLEALVGGMLGGTWGRVHIASLLRVGRFHVHQSLRMLFSFAKSTCSLASLISLTGEQTWSQLLS